MPQSLALLTLAIFDDMKTLFLFIVKLQKDSNASNAIVDFEAAFLPQKTLPID